VEKTINTKELRATLADVVRRARKGERFLVIHRSKPAFRLIPVDPGEQPLPPLEEDPLYGSPALGESRDGLSSKDHDAVLYGVRRR
jgi:prevent-host-death family protein